jgi:hypothetical protein
MLISPIIAKLQGTSLNKVEHVDRHTVRASELFTIGVGFPKAFNNKRIDSIAM